MSRKKSFIVLFALLSSVATLALAFALVLRAETKQFAPVGTGAVNPEIFTVRDGMVNLYLLEKNGAYLAVDAGTDRKNVARILAANGIDAGKVETLLLTHTDYDHVAAVPLFVNAKVYISEPEEDMLNGKARRMLFVGNSLKRDHELLADGETRTIGPWEVRTITLPGHTSGSAAYLIDGKHLFTGDTGIKDGAIVPFNAFFCMDQKLQAESLKKLDSLAGVETILTAHYGILRH